MELDKENRHFLQRDDDVFVNAPHAHQGVADALRTAFIPIENDLPDEMQELIRQLR